MQTITYNSLPELLSHMEYADQYFIREPFRDGPPLYLEASDMIADAAAGKCIADPLWTSEIVAQFGDRRDDPIIIAQIQRNSDGSYCAVADSRHLLLVQKHIVYKNLSLI